MESNRYLVKTHLITDTSFYQSNKEDIPSLVSDISFIIPPNNLEAISELLNFLTFKNKPDEFCTTIHLENHLNSFANKKWISFLIILLADINYSKFRGSHIIFIDSTADVAKTSEWVRNFLDQIGSLGFQKIIFHNIRETEHENFRIFNIESIKNISDVETLLLERNKELHFYFFSEIMSHHPEKIEDFINSVSSVEQKLRDLFMHINKLNSILARKSEYLVHLEESLRSKTEYLAFLLKPMEEKENENNPSIIISDLQKIKNFYHYEYEILPLWYKRFGHILKVIMGKRTLRSLFKNNVKKHK